LEEASVTAVLLIKVATRCGDSGAKKMLFPVRQGKSVKNLIGFLRRYKMVDMLPGHLLGLELNACTVQRR
jgi:hypothetical protein